MDMNGEHRHQSIGSTAACPCFGERERNTKELWTHSLEAVDIMAVVDLTPGSGALAEASMRRGAQYLGVCKRSTHPRWLQNSIDGDALSLVCESGTPLCQQELAERVNRHYKNILDELNGQEELSDLEASDADA